MERKLAQHLINKKLRLKSPMHMEYKLQKISYNVKKNPEMNPLETQF